MKIILIKIIVFFFCFSYAYENNFFFYFINISNAVILFIFYTCYSNVVHLYLYKELHILLIWHLVVSLYVNCIQAYFILSILCLTRIIDIVTL